MTLGLSSLKSPPNGTRDSTTDCALSAGPEIPHDQDLRQSSWTDPGLGENWKVGRVSANTADR